MGFGIGAELVSGFIAALHEATYGCIVTCAGTRVSFFV